MHLKKIVFPDPYKNISGLVMIDSEIMIIIISIIPLISPFSLLSFCVVSAIFIEGVTVLKLGVETITSYTTHLYYY